MVEKKPRQPRRKQAPVVLSEEAQREADKEASTTEVRAKITKLRGLIDLIDEKIKEKIEDDMQRVKIVTNTAEREMEGYSLTELRDIRKLYVEELKGYEKQLASLSGKTQSRMIRPYFRR